MPHGETPPDRTDCSKNIILCSDGTGNQGGKGHGTNVWRLYESLDLSDPGDSPLCRQVAFYDDGIGTERFKLLKLFAGAFGWGLSRNIRQLYAFLIRNYERGDRIYLFGFSRGAFTVRTLSGLIECCGIFAPECLYTHDGTLDKAKLDELEINACRMRWLGRLLRWFRSRLGWSAPSDISQNRLMDLGVRAAFRTYRRHRRRRDANVYAFKENLAHDANEPRAIECIGVWDTVGAIGAPSEWLRRTLDIVFRVRFSDHALAGCAKRGFHALALDDERRAFHPVLWNESERKGDIEQVWFAGAHSNVGGGYPKPGMAYVTLGWMLRRIEQAHAGDQEEEHKRLRLHAEAHSEILRRANVNDKLYDSRSGLAAYYRYKPRSMAALLDAMKGKDDRKGTTQTRVHASVFDRIATGIDDYAPINLPPDFEIVDEGWNLGRNESGGARTRSDVRKPQHDGGRPAWVSYLRQQKGFPDLEVLARKARGWIWLRTRLYEANFACTLLLVVAAITALATHDSATGPWPRVLLHPGTLTGLVIALGALAYWNRWLHRRIGAPFANFWLDHEQTWRQAREPASPVREHDDKAVAATTDG